MSLHRRCVHNRPLLFRLRSAQINDSVTKSVFSCKGPSCEEAELSDFSCFQPPCTFINFIHKSHSKLSCSMDHPGKSAGCSNTVLATTALHSASIIQGVSSSRHPLTPKTSQEHPQGVREMMVIVSKGCRETHICQPIKSRPDLLQNRNWDFMSGVKSL